MRDVENNMDELFRKAAREYPLKDSKDDWDRIAPLLVNNPVITGAPNKKNNIKKYGPLLLLLVLFLFISGITTNIWNKAKTAGLNNKSEKVTQPDVHEETTEISQRPAVVQRMVNSRKQPGNNAGNIRTQIRQMASKDIQHPEENKFMKNINSGFRNKILGNRNIETEPCIDEEIEQDVKGNQNVAFESMAVRHINSVGDLVDPVSFNKVIPVPQTINRKGSIDIAKEDTLSQMGNVKKQHGIYLGIVFGSSFNQVKGQGLKKPGYDIGILSGYQINNKFSIETGLFFEKKNYFSSGKYFDMAKASSTMPIGMKVLSLEGSSAVFEIPFKVKYNLPQQNRTHFFVSAGASTYIITNENNKYLAVINGTQQDVSGNYNNTSRYLAAAIDVSMGYEGRMGASAGIRIEPYLQIPLRGIGVGSMPVMTAGLHIGFTRIVH